MKKKNQVKKQKKFNITLGVIFGLAVSFFTFGISEVISTFNMKYMNDIINSDALDIKKAYLEVHTIPYVFAEYENEKDKFYIIKDLDYLYIVELSDSEYNEIIKSDLEEKPFVVEGYTKELPNEVKSLAIDAYNELVEEKVVNEENYELFFGSIYLNVTNINFAMYLYFGISVIFIFIGVFLLRKRGVLCLIKKSKKA